MEKKVEQLEAELRRLRVECATLQTSMTNMSEVSKTEESRIKRDLSLQSLIRSWGGGEDEQSVDSFLQNIERVAKCGGWTEQDKTLICQLKLTGAAAACVAGFPALLEPTATLEHYRKVLIERFGPTQSPAEKLLQLNSVSQRAGETVKEFADRCRKLGEETIPHGTMSAEEMEWARKQTMQVTLAAFMRGLRGEVGLPLRYQSPRTFKAAIEAATIIENAQNQVPTQSEVRAIQGGRIEGERRPPGPTVGNLTCFRCQLKGHLARECPRRRPQNPQLRNPQRQPNENRPGTKSHCYVCGQLGHFARNCAQRATPAKVCVCQHTSPEQELTPKGSGPRGAPPAGPASFQGPDC